MAQRGRPRKIKSALPVVEELNENNAILESQEKMAQSGTLEIVADTLPKDEPLPESVSDTMYVSVHLSHSLKFRNIPTRGGVKTITFPGQNESLRGKNTGILNADGHSVLVAISTEDWNNLIKLYGSMDCFKSINGLPPCLMPMTSKDEFYARHEEVASQRHGLEPLKPEKLGVMEDKNPDR